MDGKCLVFQRDCMTLQTTIEDYRSRPLALSLAGSNTGTLSAKHRYSTSGHGHIEHNYMCPKIYMLSDTLCIKPWLLERETVYISPDNCWSIKHICNQFISEIA